MKIKLRKVNRGTIGAADIITAYANAFGLPWWRILIDSALRLFHFGGVFQVTDQTYQETDEAVIKEILEKDKTDLEKYLAEDFDCDDFSFRLMGVFHQDLRTAAMPIFLTNVMTSQGGHAVLSYYHEGKVNIIEPQKDWIYNVPTDWKLMLLNG